MTSEVATEPRNSQGLGSLGKLVLGAVLLLALLFLPAPLLPPHRLAEWLQSVPGVGWKSAYLVTAVGLQAGFYGALGVLSAFLVNREPTTRGQLRQILLLLLVVIGGALVIRSVKLGHVPVMANIIIPMVSCIAGMSIGLGLLYRGWRLAIAIAMALLMLSHLGIIGRPSSDFTKETQVRLERMVAASASLPSGDDRFGALVQNAFAPVPGVPTKGKAVRHNRAAITALGIALGHERLARFAGLDPQGPLVRRTAALRQGTTLRDREDWSRHYTLSAALAVLENPLFSDAAGLIKEQMDALTGGSGFSFGDLAADRAGVRFAQSSTRSETHATAMQLKLHSGFRADDFFPPMDGLAENLSVEQFRAKYGGAGSLRYREVANDIERRLDLCDGLAPSLGRK